MKNDLISIIIPVYNVEKYLKKCVESVLFQTYSNFEILLIDDGSSDKSGFIADELSKVDSRIKTFHKPNGGLSDARNYGISKSNGKYLTFIDSDDFIEENYLEVLFSQINDDIKMSVGSMKISNGKKNKKREKNIKVEILSTEECLKRMLLEQDFNVSANAKLYEKNLFNNVKYPLNKLYEDNGTTYKLIMNCDKISCSNEQIYNYVIRKGSITNEKFTMKKMDYIYLTDEACKEIEEKYPNLKEVCEVRKVLVRLSIIRQMINKKLSNEEIEKYNEIYNYLKNNYKKILANKYSTKKIKISVKMLMINKNILKIGAKLYEKIK